MTHRFNVLLPAILLSCLPVLGQMRIAGITEKDTLQQSTHHRVDTIVISHKDTVYYMPAKKRLNPIKTGEELYPKIDMGLSRPVLAFRTNLLLPLLNIGIECPICNRWSIAADFYYPWVPRKWMNKWAASQMNCIQGLGGYLEGRYWFGTHHRLSEPAYGKYRLLGHSLGLTTGAAYYDLEWDGRGEQGEVFVAGIGYTYVLPLGKKGGVHLEFDIAAGAVYRIWHPYDVHEQGGYLIRGRDENNISIVNEKSWGFYPIKAGISLVVPIFTERLSNSSNNKTGRR